MKRLFEIYLDDATVLATARSMSSVMSRRWLVRARAEECDAMMALCDGDGVVERLVGNVGDIHHHAEAVHLEDDLLATLGEARCGARPGIVMSPEESAHSLVFDQVRVM